jgi:hypothetical protein
MDFKDWIELAELMQFLGYSDPRSLEKWCKKNKLKIIKAGLKKYVSSQKLTQILDNQYVIFEEEKDCKPKSKKNIDSNYTPTNEIISKYLTKYESKNKPRAA